MSRSSTPSAVADSGGSEEARERGLRVMPHSLAIQLCTIQLCDLMAGRTCDDAARRGSEIYEGMVKMNLPRYDYVIVGAGSAGSVMAARLSEDPNVSVALVEAGPPDTAEEIHVPVAFPRLFKTRWDWDYDSEPEPGLQGRRVYLPRGRMLGGSSSMNAMIYIRGNAADYDGWAANGAQGWSYRDVLPYFLRSE